MRRSLLVLVAVSLAAPALADVAPPPEEVVVCWNKRAGAACRTRNIRAGVCRPEAPGSSALICRRR